MTTAPTTSRGGSAIADAARARSTVDRPADPGEDPWAGTPSEPPESDNAARRRPSKVELPTYALTYRKPTGATAWPLILVEGEEYTGKSRMAVELANDPRIGHTAMLAIGEEIDWLGALADFDVVNHDGEWWQIIAAAEQRHAECTARVAAGEKIPLTILDSGTKGWELLSTQAEYRARTTDDNIRRLAVNPNAEVIIGHTHWNAANRRHRRLVTLLRSMPSIVVITARGKWVSAFDKATGKPIPYTREYSVQAQSELGYATSAWVRLAQGQHPAIVGTRMAKGGIRPDVDGPLVIDPKAPRFRGLAEKGWTGFSLSWLVFDVLKFDPAKAHTSKAVEPKPDAGPDDPGPAAPRRAVPADADEHPHGDDADVITPTR